MNTTLKIFLILIILLIILLTVLKPVDPESKCPQIPVDFSHQVSDYCRRFDLHVENNDSIVDEILIGIRIDNKWRLVVLTGFNEDSLLMIRCYLPELVAKRKIHPTAVILSQLNYDYAFGSFNMDTASGILSFRNYLDCRHINFNDSTIFNEIIWTIRQLDENFPLINNKRGHFAGDSTNQTYEVFALVSYNFNCRYPSISDP